MKRLEPPSTITNATFRGKGDGSYVGRTCGASDDKGQVSDRFIRATIYDVCSTNSKVCMLCKVPKIDSKSLRVIFNVECQAMYCKRLEAKYEPCIR